jgi:hypothetical protein
MAEPTTPPTARAAQRDVLLAAKLHVPYPARGSCHVRGCWSSWQRARHAS